MTDPGPGRLDRGDGEFIAYQARAGAGPAVVFCPGFNSDMAGRLLNRSILLRIFYERRPTPVTAEVVGLACVILDVHCVCNAYSRREPGSGRSRGRGTFPRPVAR